MYSDFRPEEPFNPEVARDLSTDLTEAADIVEVIPGKEEVELAFKTNIVGEIVSNAAADA